MTQFKKFISAIALVISSLNLVSCLNIFSGGYPDVVVESMSIEEAYNDEIYLATGDTGQLHVVWSGSYTLENYVPDYTWSSSNEDVVEIDSKTGDYVAKSEGLSTIVVVNEDVQVSTTCVIIVRDIEITDIKLNLTSKTMYIGEEYSLIATITPENATCKNLKWFSSLPQVAQVDETGKVIALKEGFCTITAYAQNDVSTRSPVSAQCIITVAPVGVREILLNATEKTLTIGEEFLLTATVVPEDATYKDIEWRSSDASVATVDSNGKVTAVKEGECSIFAVAPNSIEESCKILVSPIEVESLTFDITEKDLYIGESFTIVATISPSDATYKDVEWSSSDSGVATVDSNGNVTSVKEGECIITATASDGKIATCKVTVRPVDIESIQLDVTQKTLVEGEDFTFTVTITPTNATYKEITWMSSDSSVAVVDNNGKVTGIKEGNCVISAQTTDNKVVECDVTVKPVPVSSVTLSSSRVQMLVGDTRTLTYNVTPSHAKITSVVWSTDDESVATVSVDGVVTCKGLGTTKVTVLINGEYRAECLVHGAGIENFVSLRFGSSMVSSINGYLTGIIGCMLTNSSSQTITVKSLTIMDSYSGATVGQFSLDNVSVAPNTYIGRSIEIKIAVYKPIFRWVYIHDGKEYTIEITYEI